MTTVEIQGIAKSYQPGHPVLKPFDLAIAGGELFFLLGPSGCGKSTLLRILAGLVEPDAGSIRFNGVEITHLAPEKRRAAMVFQNYALWPHLSVFENVAFGLRTAGAGREAVRRGAMEALEVVRLADCADRRIPSLSGGQQQRVALARALAVEPALLLLDEPLSNLDARLRDEMRREIRRICKERQLTALYVTHDRQEALSMADRIAVMNGGVLQQTGTPEEVYAHPRTRFVAGFLGDADFLEGEGAENGTLRTAAGTFRIADVRLEPGAKRVAAIRPERIRILPAGTEPGENRIPARLTDRTFLGECCEWRFAAGTHEFFVVESAAPPRREGAEFVLEFPADALVVLRG